jgi:hypothetical protein
MPQDAEVISRARMDKWGDASDDELVEDINAMLHRTVNQ